MYCNRYNYRGGGNNIIIIMRKAVSIGATHVQCNEELYMSA